MKYYYFSFQSTPGQVGGGLAKSSGCFPLSIVQRWLFSTESFINPRVISSFEISQKEFTDSAAIGYLHVV